MNNVIKKYLVTDYQKKLLITDWTFKSGWLIISYFLWVLLNDVHHYMIIYLLHLIVTHIETKNDIFQLMKIKGKCANYKKCLYDIKSG